MVLEEKKITEKDLDGKGVVGMSDVPGLSAEDMQKKVEEIPMEIIKKFNELIDWLLDYGATKEELQNIVINAGAVTGVFGRRGEVRAQKGDYTAEMVGAAAKEHAAEHNRNGKDPLDIEGIGAAPNEHFHGNISRDGKIGNINDRVLVTGVGGVIEAKTRKEAGVASEPKPVAGSGEVSFTVEDNAEYEYTEVTSLNMVGGKVNCHGIITFAESIGGITVDGFIGTRGDDIKTEAAPGETWEFDVFGGKIIWANWGVINGT